MDFLKQLFGKKSDKGPSKKGWLSIAVHRPSSRIIKVVKGLMGNAGHWGEVEFLVENRIEESKKHYDFIPDEEVIGFIVENIEKVPTLDRAKPEIFERYIKGLKEQKRVSIRAYQYRKESNLKETDSLPPQYQTWVCLQDSRELKNRHATDLRDFKEEIQRRPFDSEKLIVQMTSYLADIQLFGKFIIALTEVKDLSQRINLYMQLEKIIEESTLYKQSRIEEMDYFLMMPPEQMEPIHVLACETLRDVVRKDFDGKIFGIPKAKIKDKRNYDRLCKMMLDYHTYKGLPLDYIDDEYKLRHNFTKEMDSLVEATRADGQYDESDSDAYPGLSYADSPVAERQKVDVPMGQMIQEEWAEGKQSPKSQVDPFDMDDQQREIMNVPRRSQETPAQSAAPVTPDPAAEVVTETPAAEPATVVIEEPKPALDELSEAIKSLQRLASGALLRDEIFLWREHEVITRKQLEWAFAQPYITSEKLIQNGTLHGAVLKTRYFETLFNQVANAEEGIDQLSTVDRNILLAYGTSMERTNAEYDAMLKDKIPGSNEYAAINRQKASLLSEYGRIQDKVTQLRINEQQRLMDRAIEQAERWIEHFFAGSTYALLSEEAFFKQFDDYDGHPDYLRALLSVLERQGGQPRHQTKRTIEDFIYCLQRFATIHACQDSGAAFIPHEQLQGLTPKCCGWGQVLYQLGFYLMERERLQHETGADINAVCEMIQLHMRIGKKIQAWMLHALYWVIDTEEKINRYCERIRKRFEYTWICYQTTEPESLDPYLMTEEDQRLICSPLPEALPQTALSVFNRWYNAEEVWAWYCSDEAVPGGFQPKEEPEPKRKRNRKQPTDPDPKLNEAKADQVNTNSVTNEGEGVADPLPQDPEPNTEPTTVGQEEQIDEEQIITDQQVETEPVQEEQPAAEEDSAQEMSQTEELEKQEEKEEEDPDTIVAEGSDLEVDLAFTDPTTEIDESGFIPNETPQAEDEEEDEKKIEYDGSVIDAPDEQELAEANANKELAERLINEFNQHINRLALVYTEEEQLVFGPDNEAIASVSQGQRPWQWNESHTLRQIDETDQDNFQEWYTNFGQELSDRFNQQMAIIVCEPEQLGRQIYSYISCCENETDVQQMSKSLYALGLRFEEAKPKRTMKLILDRAKERNHILHYCFASYKRIMNENKQGTYDQ